jgi:hypothetical protein
MGRKARNKLKGALERPRPGRAKSKVVSDDGFAPMLRTKKPPVPDTDDD